MSSMALLRQRVARQQAELDQHRQALNTQLAAAREKLLPWAPLAGLVSGGVVALLPMRPLLRSLRQIPGAGWGIARWLLRTLK